MSEHHQVVIRHLMTGMAKAVPSDAIPGWVSELLGNSSPRGAQFILGDNKGYGKISPRFLCLIMNAPGSPPVLVRMRFDDAGSVSVFGIDDHDVEFPDNFKDELLRMCRLIVHSDRCPHCGTEYNMGPKQRYCDKCGKPKD